MSYNNPQQSPDDETNADAVQSTWTPPRKTESDNWRIFYFVLAAALLFTITEYGCRRSHEVTMKKLELCGKIGGYIAVDHCIAPYGRNASESTPTKLNLEGRQ